MFFREREADAPNSIRDAVASPPSSRGEGRLSAAAVVSLLKAVGFFSIIFFPGGLKRGFQRNFTGGGRKDDGGKEEEEILLLLML